MKLADLIALVEPALAMPDGRAATAAFLEALRPIGAVSCQTRAYRRPDGALTSDSHWQAGGFIARLAPPGWVGSAGFNYICFDCNPLLDSIRTWRTRYRFSDFAPRGTKAYGAYWEAFSEAGIADGHCATSYRPDGAITSVHVGFADPAPDPATGDAVRLAGLLLTEHLLGIAAPAAPERPALTPRERDCLRLVADGKSDWEISVILGIGEATARFHVDNARRKLGAVNRAQAVAKLLRHEIG